MIDVITPVTIDAVIRVKSNFYLQLYNEHDKHCGRGRKKMNKKNLIVIVECISILASSSEKSYPATVVSGC